MIDLILSGIKNLAIGYSVLFGILFCIQFLRQRVSIEKQLTAHDKAGFRTNGAIAIIAVMIYLICIF